MDCLMAWTGHGWLHSGKGFQSKMEDSLPSTLHTA